jgi:methylmalonyl-CoA/ethylmalonyl-CoA epimerase
MKINHLAIAVNDIDAALAFYRDALGLELDHVEDVERESVRVAFLNIGESHIELVQPTRDDTGIAKWMNKRGEGMHHLCIEVGDIETALAEMKKRNVDLINPQPITKPNGTRYAFIHPRSAFGVLIELYELKTNKS